VFAALATALVRAAWVGDDTFITLRVVENWVNGLGPVWNAGERVQAYTHPLWMMILSAGRWVSGEAYFTTIALALVFALLTALLLAREARSAPAAVAVGVLLLTSRGFIDYAVSGLENPLGFALLTLFAGRALHLFRAGRQGPAGDGRADPARRALELAFWASLIALTRMDLVLLCAPVLAASLRGCSVPVWVTRMTIGLAPFGLWLLFSAFYYGSPFPITAHAKAFDTGVAAADLAQQGLYYLGYGVTRDPLTLVAIAAGITLGFARRQLAPTALALGCVLYLAYIVKVGGDFMGTRFFTPPFIVAVALVARSAHGIAPARNLALVAVALVLFVAPGRANWTRSFDTVVFPHDEFKGIMDERAFYYPQFGLTSPTRRTPIPGALSDGVRAAGRETPLFVAYGMVGAFAFEGGDLQHVIDPWLLDPLLMRLPISRPKGWRPGHFVRHVPTGYFETLAHGGNHIRHPGLARYYDALRIAIRGPLFARERFDALIALWSGALDAGLEDFIRDEYHHMRRVAIPYAKIATPLPPHPLGPGPQWFDEPQSKVVYGGGLSVELERAQTASAMDIQVNPGAFMVYHFTLLEGDATRATFVVDATDVRLAFGMVSHTLSIAPGTGPFDRIHVDIATAPSHTVPALGSLTLRQE